MERKKSLRFGPRTQKDVLKDKVIRKLDDGGDMFEDYWTDSDGESSTLSKCSDFSSKLPDVEASKISQTSCNKVSNFGQKIRNSPLKSKVVLHNVSKDNINADKIVSVNKETCVFEDVTVNLGVDDNNPETIALNKGMANFVRSNFHSKLPKSIPVVIQKDEVQVPIPKIRRSSQKSISRSTKLDAKGKELQSQYNECDEKIMQMVHVDYDENIESSVVSDGESLTPQSSSIKDKRSEVEKQTFKASKNIEDKENSFDNMCESYNESPSKSIKRNTRSLNQSLDDSVMAPVLNACINKTSNVSKYKKNKKDSINCQTSSSKSHSKEKSSKTFISKKNAITKNSQTVYNSANSHEDSTYSDSDVFSELAHLKEQPNKQIAANKCSVNTQIDSPKNTNSDANDSPIKNTRKQRKERKEINLQKKNYLPIHDQSKTVVLKEASPSSSKNKRKDKERKGNFDKNDAISRSTADAGANISDNENIDMSEDALGDTSNLDGNTLQSHIIESQKTITNNKSTILDGNALDATDSSDLHQLQKVRRRKTLINKRNSFIPEKNYHANTSMNSLDNSEVDIKRMSKKHRVVENGINKQSSESNKSDYVPDEDTDDDLVETDDLSELHTSKKQKTRDISIQKSNSPANVSLNSSINSVNNTFEVNDEKATINQRKMKNKNNRQNKNYMSDENIIETVDTDVLSQLQISKKQKAYSSMSERNNPANMSVNTSVNSVGSTSEVNDRKSSKNQRKIENKNKNNRQNATNRSSYVPNANIVETSDTDDSIQLQTPKKRKTRNNDVLEKNSLTKILLNSSENFIDNISEVHNKRNVKNKKNLEDNENRQKTTAVQDFHISNENAVEATELEDLSPPQNSKKQKTKNDVPERTDLANISLNSSENSFGCISEVKNKTATENRRKIKNCESRQKTAKNKKSHPETDEDITGPEKVKNRSNHLCEKNDSKLHHLSKAKVSGKSKSGLQKNNSDKAHEESNHASLPRRSNRQRFTPLARWRNERLLYRYEDGNIETIGIDKGTKEDAANLEAMIRKKALRNKKKEKIQRPKKAKVLDVVAGKEKSIYLHKKFPLISWESLGHYKTDESDEFVYSIKRMIDTSKSSFGYIQIDVGKKKPSQFMPEEDLQLTLLQGKVEINIYNCTYILERQDMFLVPRGSAYSITNNGTQRALLSYAVGKFNFLSSP